MNISVISKNIVNNPQDYSAEQIENYFKEYANLVATKESNDYNHLTWIYNRLIHVHGENPQYDYMLRLEEIINKLSKQ
jgi:hypothetical protein